MKTFPDNSVDLTVTSPPYDNLRDYKGYSFDFENIAKELFRVTKKGGVVVWVVGDATINGSETGTSFRQALFFKEIGFNLHDTMIYEQNLAPFPEINRYYSTFEYMFVFSKGKPNTTNLIADKVNATAGSGISGRERRANGDLVQKSGNRLNRTIKDFSVRNNIWRYAIGKQHSTLDDFAFQHPAIFPEQLAKDHILSWSNEGDTVLDCFLGSGTTGKMAMITKRKFIGIEISPEYLEIAEARIKRANLEPCDIPQRQANLKDTPLFDTIS